MSKAAWIAIALACLLVVSNAWWIYRVIDQSVTLGYLRISLVDNKLALAQSLAVIEEAARPDATRASIVDAALQAAGPADQRPTPFEKDGYLSIGGIGLAFDDDEALVTATRAWSPP